MNPIETRRYWIDTLVKITSPVLTALAEKRLHKDMPVEGCTANRPLYTHLEALGRSLTGMAPWLASRSNDPDEATRREHCASLARAAIDSATDPDSPDYCNFENGQQPLVDAAFLAHAILRARGPLWEQLEPRVKQNLVTALKKTRHILPHHNNWLLFSAMVESALYIMEGDCDMVRVDYAISQHEQWFKGDGVYGDGPAFHWDYYNSYVIQPMMIDIMDTVGHLLFTNKEDKQKNTILARAQKYATFQEQLIAPDGSFPAIGRSITYRSGAFQLLAQMALREQLPDGITPAAVRCALTAVIRRTMEEPGTFDENGWLKIGLCGHQPELGNTYISTGSLYLCTTIFLPLGLDEDAPFWSTPDEPWSWKKLWH